MIEPPDPSVRITGVSAGRGRSPIIGDLTAPPATAPRGPGGPELADRELSLIEGVPPAERPIVVVVELDSSFPGGLRAQQDAFEEVWDAWWASSGETGASKEPITGSLYQCVLTRTGLARLVQLDQDRTTESPGDPARLAGLCALRPGGPLGSDREGRRRAASVQRERVRDRLGDHRHRASTRPTATSPSWSWLARGA